MSDAALNISPEAMTVYRTNARRRWEQEQRDLDQRKARAWNIARQAAALLKDRFGAVRVVVFGSLIQANCFTRWSDVDVAAWGIATDETFYAIGAVLDLRTDIEINLVDVSTCRPSLLATIGSEGIDI